MTFNYDLDLLVMVDNGSKAMFMFDLNNNYDFVRGVFLTNDLISASGFFYDHESKMYIVMQHTPGKSWIFDGSGNQHAEYDLEALGVSSPTQLAFVPSDYIFAV